MNRSDLEIILLKYGASEALRKELLVWAFDATDSNTTQTFHPEGLAGPSDENAEHTFVLGRRPSPAQEKAHSQSPVEESQNIFRPKPESVNLKEYEDIRLLGAGGMGEVRLVRDRILQRTLAMKIMSRQRIARRPCFGALKRKLCECRFSIPMSFRCMRWASW